MKGRLSETGKDLVLGIVAIVAICSLAGGIIMNLISGGWIPFILGELLGGAIAVGLTYHMDMTISNALDLEEEAATKYARKMSFFRYFFMIASILIVLTFPRVFSIAGLLLGIMALKFSAYLQPFISKYITKKQ